MAKQCALLLAVPAVAQNLFLSSSARSESVPALPEESQWAALTQLLQGWEFTTEYVITIGTAEHGRLFTYQGGNLTLDDQIPTLSTSKWPSAMMVAGLVEDGTIKSLDDPVSKYLSWWTTNESDSRSLVTVRSLLSFTSGFGGGGPGAEFNTRKAREWRKRHGVQGFKDESGLPSGLTSDCNSVTGDIMKCARQIYETVELVGKPGEVWSYNSNHLQIAGALAVAASGLDLDAVMKTYLFDRFNMTQSFYRGRCPDLSGSLVTTGRDYEQFLKGVLGYTAMSKRLVDESERDYTTFMNHSQYTLYGHYAFGHFLSCFDSVHGFTEECKHAQVHMDPGGFGFIPILDRRNGYYLQVVTAETPPTGSYPLSGIPEYLAVAIKSVVDAIMSEHPPNPSDYGYHTPEYFSMSVADVNYCLGCKLHPETCA